MFANDSAPDLAARSAQAARENSRRADLVDAACSLYEEKGLSCTSIQDIASRVGVTRSLFYHYFPHKDAITSAVLDTYVSDFVEAVSYWNEDRREGDIESALISVVRLLRLALFDEDSFRIALATRENAALYIEFLNRVADRVATYLMTHTVPDYEALHDVEIEHVHETFYILIVGLVSFLRRNPKVSDEVVKTIIAQTLHLKR